MTNPFQNKDSDQIGKKGIHFSINYIIMGISILLILYGTIFIADRLGFWQFSGRTIGTHTESNLEEDGEIHGQGGGSGKQESKETHEEDHS